MEPAQYFFQLKLVFLLLEPELDHGTSSIFFSGRTGLPPTRTRTGPWNQQYSSWTRTGLTSNQQGYSSCTRTGSRKFQQFSGLSRVLQLSNHNQTMEPALWFGLYWSSSCWNWAGAWNQQHWVWTGPPTGTVVHSEVSRLNWSFCRDWLQTLEPMLVQTF